MTLDVVKPFRDRQTFVRTLAETFFSLFARQPENIFNNPLKSQACRSIIETQTCTGPLISLTDVCFSVLFSYLLYGDGSVQTLLIKSLQQKHLESEKARRPGLLTSLAFVANGTNANGSGESQDLICSIKKWRHVRALKHFQCCLADASQLFILPSL